MNPKSNERSEPVDSKAHWENVYRTKAHDEVSWFAPHLETSMQLIANLAPDLSASIIDIGGGGATLIDDLLALGYNSVSVLDISGAAIDIAKKRAGTQAKDVTWMVADVLDTQLPEQGYNVWHDRAVFHFLTTEEQRQKYVQQVSRCIKPGGYVIMATFGPQGPEKCSGLEVVRYDSSTLHGEFGRQFKLLGSSTELHKTPFGTTQEFLYCYCLAK